jgi:hypothetical protein
MTNLKYQFSEFLMNMQSLLLGNPATNDNLQNLQTYKLDELYTALPGWEVRVDQIQNGKKVYLENRNTKLTVLYNDTNNFIGISDEYWKDLNMHFTRRNLHK